jgi:hypothetical protein
MGRVKTKTWLDLALDDPMRTFGTPAEVLRDARLDEVGMRAVPTAWLQDAKRMTESADEGMAGGEDSLLPEVECALAELDRGEGVVRDEPLRA